MRVAISRAHLALLPFLIAIIVSLNIGGYLDISLVKIKAHELKITTLDYSPHYQENDPFKSGETVRTITYEDGLLSVLPQYSGLLEKDLKQTLAYIDTSLQIEYKDLTFTESEYHIVICLDQMTVNSYDSTLFKTIVNQEILTSLELYDKFDGRLLVSSPNQKYRIRNEIIFFGWTSESFLHNKLEEIWISQIAQKVKGLISSYENPLEDRVYRLAELPDSDIFAGFKKETDIFTK